MATKLERPLRREVSIGGRPFVVTLSPEGVKLVGKGRRRGLELSWQDLVSGEAALATALRASITGDVQLEPSKNNVAQRPLRTAPESSASRARSTERKARRSAR
ncbi:MAG TPA: hypothetical protein VE935_05585 [Burkholderiales bacterium]|jgi:hypothetical protein|nr:hypothetical protein [Burkholderiales bacterium]